MKKSFMYPWKTSIYILKYHIHLKYNISIIKEFLLISFGLNFEIYYLKTSMKVGKFLYKTLI